MSKSLCLREETNMGSNAGFTSYWPLSNSLVLGSQFCLYNGVNKVSMLPKVILILIFIKYEHS